MQVGIRPHGSGTDSGSPADAAQVDGSVFVHPAALCETDQVGPRTRVWAFAHVLPGARIGSDCNICDSVFIEGGATIGDRVTVKNAVLIWHGVLVEDDVFLGPNVVFTNDLRPRAPLKKDLSELLPTRVRRGATIGANSTVICGTTIGEYAFVAAATVVARDVPAHALVVGNPGRRVGWVCECGQRLDARLACDCGNRYRLVSRSAGLRRRDVQGGEPDRVATVAWRP